MFRVSKRRSEGKPPKMQKKRKNNEENCEEPEEPLGEPKETESPYFPGRNRPGMWGVGVMNVAGDGASTSRPSQMTASVNCNCHQSAVLLTVRKEGPNLGRLFYGCPDRKCNFFLWAPPGTTAPAAADDSSQTATMGHGSAGGGRRGKTGGRGGFSSQKKKWKRGGFAGNRGGRDKSAGRGKRRTEPTAENNFRPVTTAALNAAMFPKI